MCDFTSDQDVCRVGTVNKPMCRVPVSKRKKKSVFLSTLAKIERGIVNRLCGCDLGENRLCSICGVEYTDRHKSSMQHRGKS